MSSHRLLTIPTACLALCAISSGDSLAEEPFSWEHLQDTARALAAQPHQPPRQVAGPFQSLDYDGYRLIAPRHQSALWHDTDLPFWVEFFPAGFLFEYPVEIRVVDQAGIAQQLDAGERWFQFRGAAKSLANEPGGGFSGFRLLAQLPGNTNREEFTVFQGASYFRARGAQQNYGASARGLAIDIGLAKPEEFPRFTKFWIEQPQSGDKRARVWALMDSPGVAGAYEFTVTPGAETVVDVEAHVWFRHGLQKLAIAPLTSMWMWNAANQPTNDPRPEVHDSDGLLIHMGADDWIWRPLRRPQVPRVSQWPTEELHGFGLIQRDRDIAHYQDNEALYHIRPSVWVTPEAEWGTGRVELLELPSEHEGGDNIGAYWVSDKPATAGGHRVLKYRITFGGVPTRSDATWSVADTSIAPATDGTALVEIQFSGKQPLAGPTFFTPEVTCDAGTIDDVELVAMGQTRGVLRFRYTPPAEGASRLQARLRMKESPISETWSYIWTPN